jgi:hypothetical protein
LSALGNGGGFIVRYREMPICTLSRIMHSPVVTQTISTSAMSE